MFMEKHRPIVRRGDAPNIFVAKTGRSVPEKPNFSVFKREEPKHIITFIPKNAEGG
jgi:hypothetical protein